MTSFTDLTIPSTGQDEEQQEPSFTAAKSTESHSHFGTVFTKINTLLPSNPAIKLLGIYPAGGKTHVYIKTHMTG